MAKVTTFHTPVPVTRLRAEPAPLTSFSGMVDPTRLVIRDADTWRATWAAIWRDLQPAPDLPVVDFTREMIVVASLGQRSSGGYAVFIDSASSTQSELVVHVRSVSPGAGCFTTAALTQPVDAARLPMNRLPVRFVEHAEVHECQ